MKTTLALPALLALSACNGIVGAVPVEVSGGTLTASGDAHRAVLRLSEARSAPGCGVEEPSDVEVVISLANDAGIDPGVYDITGGARSADARLTLTDKSCAALRDDAATSGAVHVNTIDLHARATGSYDLVFDTGELSGRFDAGACVLAGGGDVDVADCDDVDHDGEPGGTSGGGGDGD